MSAPGDAEIWATIIGLALATYAIRFSFLGLIGARPLPPAVVRALSFVPVTVLPALAAPAVFGADDGGLALDPVRVLPAAMAVAVGMATGRLLPGLLAGAGAWGLAAAAGL